MAPRRWFLNLRPRDRREDPTRPHTFRDSSSGVPFEGLLRGRMTAAEAFEGLAGRCALCRRLRDDPIHAPQDHSDE